MTLSMLRFKCGQCGNVFEAPDALEYGDFVLRSKGTGEPAFLHALDDTVWAELDQMLRSPGAYGQDELDKAKLLHSVFGAVCDPAPDGTQYEVGGMPCCPACQSKDMASWEPAGRLLPADCPIPLVRHSKWDQMEEGDKKRLVLKTLSDLA